MNMEELEQEFGNNKSTLQHPTVCDPCKLLGPAPLAPSSEELPDPKIHIDPRPIVQRARTAREEVERIFSGSFITPMGVLPRFMGTKKVVMVDEKGHACYKFLRPDSHLGAIED